MHSKALGLDENFSFLRLFQTGSINVVVIAINRHSLLIINMPSVRFSNSVEVTYI